VLPKWRAIGGNENPTRIEPNILVNQQNKVVSGLTKNHASAGTGQGTLIATSQFGCTDVTRGAIAIMKDIKEVSKMNEQIRKAIRQRARRAVSRDDLVRAVFDSFKSQQVELRNVTLEDMKAALVEAARAQREHSPVAA